MTKDQFLANWFGIFLLKNIILRMYPFTNIGGYLLLIKEH